MAKRDYYDVLGVDRTADDKALKSAYRKLAMQYHPDRNPGDAEAEARFKEVGEAYAALSDPQKRTAYDQMGHAAFEGGMGGGGQGPFGGHAGAADFADIFEQVFGGGFGGMGGRQGGRRSNGPARGSDLRFDLEVSLKDAFDGKSETLKVPTNLTCERCDGIGAEPGTSLETCTTCGGQGVVTAGNGMFRIRQTCPACGGQGKTVSEPCHECDGVGQVRKVRTLTVDIPAGVEDGMRIRLAGEGESGARGGPRGDLYIFVSIRNHDLFERDGPNLYCRATVPMVTAALGGAICCPVIDGGKAELKIPSASQTGKRMRLKGKGMPRLRGGPRGDMIVELFVETPRNLTDRQKELLQEFCELSGGNCNPESEGFVGKARRFWEDLTSEDGRPSV
ncbi:MAG: molecular chaperone DnaJ [Rhodobacterales bacterium CG15_BIG_FIL_POST_REV_8_21_14_020_59_13]|nr:MAG: molecular chaperone DnaJ [Rhodobacterales bacterium CG15_BIG_FIL_POST_REV_8_21_14_020_59_13]